MILTLHLLLLIGAAVCFLLAVFNVPRLNWTALGLLLFIISLIIH